MGSPPTLKAANLGRDPTTYRAHRWTVPRQIHSWRASGIIASTTIDASTRTKGAISHNRRLNRRTKRDVLSLGVAPLVFPEPFFLKLGVPEE
jgi:hypothetical protein